MSQLKICPQCGTEYELDQRFCPKDGSTLRMQNAAGDLVGAIIADRYHVLRKLGEGGMGQVYLAEHVKMGRKSAVKVMNPGMVNDADAISRFNREAANASRINHPNVAAVYDFGETSEGLIYLAMEFIEGPSLTKVIEEQGALPPLRAADINRQAAEALTIAHDMGIVHRDLKPDNIMIAKNRDGGDLVKVVDFGIAKAANSEAQKVTKTGLVVGTPEYMSPEQLAGDKLDGRSDIYSLALVAFNMLTGRLPFPAETVQESMIMRLTDRPRTLGDMRPDVGWTPEVQAVLDKALERDAALRYQTAAEFGRDLYRAVEAMPATEMATAGTQVIGAAAVPAGAGATVAAAPAVPRTRVATPADVAPAASAAPVAKSKMPMFAGIAAAVVILGGGGAYMAMRPHGPAAPDSLKVATLQQGSADSAGRQAGPAGGNVPSAPVTGNTAAQTPAVTMANKLPANPAASGMTSDQVDAELARLDKLSDSPSPADQKTVLTGLGKVKHYLVTDDQKVLSALIAAAVYAQRDNTDQTCSELNRVKTQAEASSLWAPRFKRFYLACQ